MHLGQWPCGKRADALMLAKTLFQRLTGRADSGQSDQHPGCSRKYPVQRNVGREFVKPAGKQIRMPGEAGELPLDNQTPAEGATIIFFLPVAAQHT